jgi:H+/gluconate symporter-like permease
MLLGAESSDVPSLDALLPPWAQQLSLLGLLIAIVFVFMRGYIVTRSQAGREAEAERRIADIWKENFDKSTELNEQLTKAFQPVLDQNAAILKAVEAVQARQLAAEDRERWLRDRRSSE